MFQILSFWKEHCSKGLPLRTSHYIIKYSLQSIYRCIMKLLLSIIKSSPLKTNEQIKMSSLDPCVLISFSCYAQSCTMWVFYSVPLGKCYIWSHSIKFVMKIKYLHLRADCACACHANGLDIHLIIATLNSFYEFFEWVKHFYNLIQSYSSAQQSLWANEFNYISVMKR